MGLNGLPWRAMAEVVCPGRGVPGRGLGDGQRRWAGPGSARTATDRQKGSPQQGVAFHLRRPRYAESIQHGGSYVQGCWRHTGIGNDEVGPTDIIHARSGWLDKYVLTGSEFRARNYNDTIAVGSTGAVCVELSQSLFLVFLVLEGRRSYGVQTEIRRIIPEFDQG